MRRNRALFIWKEIKLKGWEEAVSAPGEGGRKGEEGSGGEVKHTENLI